MGSSTSRAIRRRRPATRTVWRPGCAFQASTHFRPCNRRPILQASGRSRRQGHESELVEPTTVGAALEPIQEGRAGSPPALRRVITLRHAVAIYVSSLLGSGIFVIPGLAARIAGPASIVSWALLSLASYPFAYTFAKLSAKRPESGGIYAFARDGIGLSAGAATVAAASYLAFVFPLTRLDIYLAAASILILAFVVNYVGIRFTGRVQLARVAAILVALVIAVVASAPRVRPANYTPFLPSGLGSIGTAGRLDRLVLPGVREHLQRGGGIQESGAGFPPQRGHQRLPDQRPLPRRCRGHGRHRRIHDRGRGHPLCRDDVGRLRFLRRGGRRAPRGLRHLRHRQRIRGGDGPGLLRRRAGRRVPEDARHRGPPDRRSPPCPRLPDRLGPREPPGVLPCGRGLCDRVSHGERGCRLDVRHRLDRRNPASQRTRDPAGASVDLPPGVPGPPTVHRRAPGGERRNRRHWSSGQLGVVSPRTRRGLGNVRTRPSLAAKRRQVITDEPGGFEAVVPSCLRSTPLSVRNTKKRRCS